MDPFNFSHLELSPSTHTNHITSSTSVNSIHIQVAVSSCVRGQNPEETTT